MEWKQDVLMNLAFDCTPVEPNNTWDIADQKMDAINAFLANGDDPIGTADPRLTGSVLYVTLNIPDVTLQQVASLYTTVDNFVTANPPPPGGPMPKYFFIAEGFIAEGFIAEGLGI